MSSLTLMEFELIMDVLNWMLDAPPASRGTAFVSREERARREEARRREREREEERIRVLEREAEARFERQTRKLEEQRKAYARREAARREAALREQNEKLEALKKTVSSILEETAETGADFLGDYSNLVFSRDLYERIADGRAQISKAARDILNEAQFVSADGGEEKTAQLAKKARELKSAWATLREDMAKIAKDDAEEKERGARFEMWLSELGDGAAEMEAAFAVFPELPEDDAGAHAEAAAKAARYVQYYLYGPDSFYVGSEQKDEIRRLYGLPGDEEDFSGIGAEAEADIEQRNRRFEAALRRAADRRIFVMRGEVREAYSRYLKMQSRLGIPGDAQDAELSSCTDAEQLLEVLEERLSRMSRKFASRMKRELVQSVVDRALRTAKRGMSVRQLTEEETQAGNWKGLYQVGQSGTTLEVYADARGQVTIEAGAVLDGGSMEPNAAQTNAIVRNNRRFCSSELPAIVERLEEELASMGEGAAVQVRETQGPDSVHVFDAAGYKKGMRGALVLKRDGTAVAKGAPAGTGTEEVLYMEDDA